MNKMVKEITQCLLKFDLNHNMHKSKTFIFYNFMKDIHHSQCSTRAYRVSFLIFLQGWFCFFTDEDFILFLADEDFMATKMWLAEINQTFFYTPSTEHYRVVWENFEALFTRKCEFLTTISNWNSVGADMCCVSFFVF